MDKNIIFILAGMIALATMVVATTAHYENNMDEVETLSPWVGIPLVILAFYVYIYNFGYLTYVISIGAVVLLFM